MKHPVIAGRPVNRPTEHRSYQDRHKNLLTRFVAASALVHLTALTLPGWPTSEPRLLAVPSLQVLLKPAAVSKPVSAIAVENTSRRSIAAPIPVTTKPGQAHAGPTETAAASSAPSGEAERLNHLQTLLRGALDRQFVYPPLARRHGWQGKVELTVELDAEGHLHNMRVRHSSGHTILDHDALTTLARIGTLPQARNWLAGRGYRFELPIVYRLVEG